MYSYDWGKAWKESQAGSTIRTQTISEDGWEKYWDVAAPQYLKEIKEEESFYDEIVEYLVRNRALCIGDSVLDIACGPGTYTLLFARFARSVTGLDYSAGMLNTLETEAKRRGMNNISTLRTKWEDFGQTAKYDHVFTSLSPAVRDENSLLRMEDHSSRTCCYVTFGDTGDLRLRNELWSLLVGEYNSGDSYSVTYPFNLLYSKGRKPSLRFFERESVIRIPSEVLIDNYTVYFRIFTNMDAGKRKLLEDYVNSRSENGIFERRTKKSLAVMHWEVPEDKTIDKA